MKREVLSLKSIYKFLTLNDYPVYSEGIIKKDNRIGLTLTKFCTENILVDFKNRKTGKIIWRTEGSRNRYVSEICNRSSRLSVYKEYAEEIAAAADYDTVLRQIRQFMAFLLERHYNTETFFRKISALINIYEKEDEAFTPDAANFFNKTIEERKSLEGQGIMTDTFCCGWVLTMLMLHALMGNGEGEEPLHRIRGDKNYSLLCMLKRYTQERQQDKGNVTFITGTNTELSCPPLKPGHFFGREMEVFELREMLRHNGAYLVSGIGGSGKTELMRQFIKVCREEVLVDYIGIIQYEGGIAKSFVKAFPQLFGNDLEENYREVLTRIRLLSDKKILLIVDNMDGGVEEKELEMLLTLPVTLFVTSRYQKLKGFKTYRLKSIGKDAASLIFRDNYGIYLDEEDKQILDDLVEEELWCHTLTLRLLASTAKNNGWSIQKLKEQLDLGKIPVGYTESERYEGLKQVYRLMYDAVGLISAESHLLRLFAALPYRNYELTWLQEYLQGAEKIFENLWIKGWLEKSENGYSMHPFVAECVLSTALTEKECTALFEGIIARWENMGKTVSVGLIPEILYENNKYAELDAGLVQTTMLLRPILGKLSGRLSGKYTGLYLMSIAIDSIYYGITKSGLESLEKIKAKTSELSLMAKVGLGIMMTGLQYPNLEEQRQLFEQVKLSKDLPLDMKFAFAENLAGRYYHSGDLAKAEEYNAFVAEQCTCPAIRIAACFLNAYMEVQKGDHGTYGEWLQKTIVLARDNHLAKSKEMQLALSNLCDLHMAMGQFEEAGRLIAELEHITENKSYFLAHHILHRKGNLAMYSSTEDFGVEMLKESIVLAEALYSKTEPGNYATVIADLAIALNKARKFEESAKYYKQAMKLYMSLDGYDFEKHRILNNMSVMYLDWGMPEDALVYLEDAYKRAKEFGGLPLGETANNYSKAYRALGNREKELEYLQEAVPVLEQFYGSEHPKVVDAKDRLK